MIKSKNVDKLVKKIKSNKAVISVIGLGYVGLPLCIAFTKANFKVFGIDNNIGRINILKNRSNEEDAMLSEAFFVKENSRLGCQIQITQELDGLVFELAPE